jgi:hypothetical protein
MLGVGGVAGLALQKKLAKLTNSQLLKLYPDHPKLARALSIVYNKGLDPTVRLAAKGAIAAALILPLLQLGKNLATPANLAKLKDVGKIGRIVAQDIGEKGVSGTDAAITFLNKHKGKPWQFTKKTLGRFSDWARDTMHKIIRTPAQDDAELRRDKAVKAIEKRSPPKFVLPPQPTLESVEALAAQAPPTGPSESSLMEKTAEALDAATKSVAGPPPPGSSSTADKPKGEGMKVLTSPYGVGISTADAYSRKGRCRPMVQAKKR